MPGGSGVSPQPSGAVASALAAFIQQQRVNPLTENYGNTGMKMEAAQKLDFLSGSPEPHMTKSDDILWQPSSNLNKSTNI